MRKRQFYHCVSLVLSGCLLVGCAGDKTLAYLGDAGLRYYRDYAMQVEYPDVSEPPSETAMLAEKPHTVRDRGEGEIWDMSLAEAIHLALLNNKIVRTSTRTSTGSIVSGSAGGTQSSNILRAPQAISSVFDPAIQETGVLFGGRGIEAALAAFDTQFTTSMFWRRNEAVQNNPFTSTGLTPGNTLQTDTGNFSTELRKSIATGGEFSLSHDVDYLFNSAPSNLFPSVFTGALTAQFRQPLWAGSGVPFTRTAGPVSTNIQGLSGVNQGVLIARINNDVTIADFQIQVRNMIKDVEDVYWNLYLSYRRYDAEVVSRNSTRQTWVEVNTRFDVGTVSKADAAQARGQFFSASARATTEWNNILSLELELRRLCGLSVNDGRMIRPADEPTITEFHPDWYAALADALTQRAELRRQKWTIKSLELQLSAAKNLAHPRLDLVSSYSVNAFGDGLFGRNDNDRAGTVQGLDSFYETLTQGDQTSWGAGIQFSMPIGFRSALAQVRNLELRLAKARKLLAAQEIDISHELADAFQTLDLAYANAQTHFNVRHATEIQVQAFDAEYKAGTKTLDRLLQAQADLARAEINYFSNVIEYTKAITNIHFRKGTLLDFNHVHLAEGGWTPQAQQQALQRARARSYAIDADFLEAEPEPFASYGPIGTVEFAPAPALHGLAEEEDGQLPTQDSHPADLDSTAVPPSVPGFEEFAPELMKSQPLPNSSSLWDFDDDVKPLEESTGLEQSSSSDRVLPRRKFDSDAAGDDLQADSLGFADDRFEPIGRVRATHKSKSQPQGTVRHSRRTLDLPTIHSQDDDLDEGLKSWDLLPVLTP